MCGWVLIQGQDVEAVVRKDIRFVKVSAQVGAIGGSVRKIFQCRDGFLWVGTTAGLYRYDGYEFRQYQHRPHDTTSISGFDILEIVQDDKGLLWIGMEGSGLSIYDPVLDRFRNVRFSYPSKHDYVNVVWGVMPDGDHVWVATRDGLIRLHRETLEHERFLTTPEPAHEDAERTNMLRQIRPDPFDEDKLWYSSLSGLYALSKSSGQIDPHFCSTLPVIYPHPHELDLQYMYAEFEWLGDHWLLGAYGGGHYQYHPATQEWFRTLVEPVVPTLPLSYNIIYQYERLRDSAFAFSGSQSGIFYPASGRVELFATGDNYLASTRSVGLLADCSGYLWIGTGEGLYRSEQVIASAHGCAGSMYFPEIRVDNLLHIIPSPSEDILLKPGQRSLFVRYAYVAPAEAMHVQYRHRLFPRQQEWTAAGLERMVSFTDLAAGDYLLSVQAIDNVRGVVLAEQSLSILVEQVFWKRPLFVFLVALVIIALAGGVGILLFRQMKARLQLRTEYERNLAQSEMTALRAQLNPHFLFNSLNSIKHFIITNEPRSATHYLNKFARLMRLALDNSRFSFIPLETEIEFLGLFLELEQLRLSNRFDYHITVDKDIDAALCMIPPLMIQPFVENAIWHGLIHKQDKGILDIRFSKEDAHLLVQIEDDGIGRESSKKHKSDSPTRQSMGVQLIENRLDLLRKVYDHDARLEIRDLIDSEGQPCGTLVSLYLPFKNSK